MAGPGFPEPRPGSRRRSPAPRMRRAPPWARRRARPPGPKLSPPLRMRAQIAGPALILDAPCRLLQQPHHTFYPPCCIVGAIRLSVLLRRKIGRNVFQIVDTVLQKRYSFPNSRCSIYDIKQIVHNYILIFSYIQASPPFVHLYIDKFTIFPYTEDNTPALRLTRRHRFRGPS